MWKERERESVCLCMWWVCERKFPHYVDLTKLILSNYDCSAEEIKVSLKYLDFIE